MQFEVNKTNMKRIENCDFVELNQSKGYMLGNTNSHYLTILVGLDDDGDYDDKFEYRISDHKNQYGNDPSKNYIAKNNSEFNKIIGLILDKYNVPKKIVKVVKKGVSVRLFDKEYWFNFENGKLVKIESGVGHWGEKDGINDDYLELEITDKYVNYEKALEMFN